MFKTISIIITSVALFGVLLFIFVKNSIKRRIDYYLELDKKKRKFK